MPRLMFPTEFFLKRCACCFGLIQYNRCHRAGLDLTGNKAALDAQCDRHTLFRSVQQHDCQCAVGIHEGHGLQLVRVAGCRNPLCSRQYIMAELCNVVVGVYSMPCKRRCLHPQQADHLRKAMPLKIGISCAIISVSRWIPALKRSPLWVKA